jgi:hypothetical protein
MPAEIIVIKSATHPRFVAYFAASQSRRAQPLEMFFIIALRVAQNLNHGRSQIPIIPEQP